ncbi:ParB/RepB/Spo0J family partition protein [Paucibacter sp. R3-3]|uniref:ParB/RepB/Spo0J family partition protein n=1 Tax=Roseateles agri TaxID=3098619 RepID=A0ABU5DM09_9BURK|nr:ParB/RepB/Spo0J family partition protein [Paucibacter sp. R3-3]MDY0747338.1 ParB/RepB/Spo0J family partition protein [Paucibacter sp. R3-3]
MSTIEHKTEPAVYVPLGLIAPSPTNPRKRFKQAKIDELAESIKKHGVIQPVLLRRNPAWHDGNGQPPHELVCGERRWRASKQAEKPTILALIRDLTDFEALEIQLLENIDRDDLHPLEEAEGLQKLLHPGEGMQGYASVEELAAKIGKSKRWIYLRLSLLNLCEPAREAFLDDKLNASVAGLIARMPNEDQQRSALKRILEGFGGEPLSFRASAEFLRKEFMLDLSLAPFDIRAVFQIAGPCSDCKKRSGASPDLFDDVKQGDMCQDSACFRAKQHETWELKFAEAEAAGHTVLRGVAAITLMPKPTALPNGHLWFDQPAPTLTADKRILSEIFGAKQRGVITLEHGPSGQILRIVPETDARKLLKSKNLLRPPAAPTPAPPPKPTLSDAATAVQAPSSSASPAAPQPRSEQTLAAMRGERACKLFGVRAQTLLLERMNTQGLPLAALRLAVAQLAGDLTYEATALIYRAHGWDIPPANTFMSSAERAKAERDFLHRIVNMEDGRLLGTLLAQVLMAEELTDPYTLEDIEASNYDGEPTWTIATELGVADQVAALAAEAEKEASSQIQAEEDERLGKNAAGDAFAAAHAPAKPGQVKYRNAATGETWSGRGLQPAWLKAAIAAGARLEDFTKEAA